MSDVPPIDPTRLSIIGSNQILPETQKLFEKLDFALQRFNALLDPKIDSALAEIIIQRFININSETIQHVLIPGLNSDLLAAGKPRLTENEMQALINDNQLAGAVFHGGLRASIIAGKASVAGLATLPPEARDLLRSNYMQEALNKGAITLEDLSKLDSNALVQAQNLVATGNFDRKTEAGKNNFRELTGLLRLPQDREGSLDSAFDTVRERTRVVNPGPAQDSLPRPLPPGVDHPPLPDSGHGNVR